MYRVVKFFTDLQDGNNTYNVGDKYPREGYTPSNDRINTLLSSNNKQGTPLIKFEDEEEAATVAEEVTVAEDSPVAESEKVYDEDALSELTTKEIKALAEERGYRITRNSKAAVIDQFLKQQR